MSGQATQHVVTIRLEEHVEQLEQAYRAFIAVRRQLEDAQHAACAAAGENVATGLKPVIHGLRRAALLVNEAMLNFELPCVDGAAAEPA